MNARTQIYLPPEDHRRAKLQAAEHGISLAEYVRRLISRDLGEQRPGADPELVFDLGATEGSDIARNKDAYLGEALGKREEPPTVR